VCRQHGRRALAAHRRTIDTSFDRLKKYTQVLELNPGPLQTYWGDKSERGRSFPSVDRDQCRQPAASGPFPECRDVGERIAAKSGMCATSARLHSIFLPSRIRRARCVTRSRTTGRETRAADIHFNHDKAVRIARHELLACVMSGRLRGQLCNRPIPSLAWIIFAALLRDAAE